MVAVDVTVGGGVTTEVKCDDVEATRTAAATELAAELAVCVGGGWKGGGVEDDDCSTTELRIALEFRLLPDDGLFCRCCA